MVQLVHTFLGSFKSFFHQFKRTFLVCVIIINVLIQVCVDVTEIQCEVVPYTECEMVMLPTPYKTFEMDQSGRFPVRECNETTEKIKHTKMMPECRNVTKQNCVTNWETDADGNQV